MEQNKEVIEEVLVYNKNKLAVMKSTIEHLSQQVNKLLMQTSVIERDIERILKRGEEC